MISSTLKYPSVKILVCLHTTHEQIQLKTKKLPITRPHCFRLQEYIAQYHTKDTRLIENI